MDIREIDRILSPDEDDKQYNNFNSDKGLLDIAKKGAPIALGLGGLGTAGYAVKQAISSMPGGYGKTLADNMHNYLQDKSGHFYRPPSPVEAKIQQVTGIPVHKANLATKEFGRGAGRIGKQFFNPIATQTYRQTGVTPFVIDMYNKHENAIKVITDDYIKGKFDFESAKNSIRNLEKQLHFKVTSDFSNSYLYKQLPKGLVKNYGSKYVKLGSQADFIKEAGSKKIADYVIGRQNLGLKGTKLLKYKHVNFSDVARGAQFDPKFYRTMLKLKDKPDVFSARNAVNKGMNLPKASIIGPKTIIGKAGKVVFNLSPSIRANYDWGGFNAVGIWDPKDAKHIRIMATDGRDLFGAAPGNSTPTVNYVQSKKIEIKDLKKEFTYEEPKAPKESSGKKYVSRTPEEIRLEKSKELRMNKGKFGQSIKDDIIDPFKKTYNKNSSRLSKVLKNPNIMNKSGRNQLLKTMKPFLRRAGVVGGSLALALAAWQLINKD